MVVTDGVVSLKHLVSMEILSNEEVLGIIKRGLAFKEKKVTFSLDRQYFAANLFFESSTSCLLYTSPSPRDPKTSRMPSSA